MADKLPVIKANQELARKQAPTSTLLGRGLAAIQQRQIAIVDQDERYLQARDIYEQITDYGWERRFDPDLLIQRNKQPDLFADDTINELQPLRDKTNQLADVFRQLKQLADEGYGKAYFLLCTMCWGGQGVTQNIESFKYYRKLAFDWLVNHQTSEDPEIWRDLAWMYLNGLGINEGVTEIERIYREREDVPKAVFWYRKAAEQGHADAQFNLGLIFDNRQGNELAVYWYSEAAQQGHPSAQCNLGAMYEQGRGVEQNYEQAVFWYRKAAEQSYAQAQYYLGQMYAEGRGVEQDDKLVVYWYGKAAEQGLPDAQCDLGWMYAIGHGVENDIQCNSLSLAKEIAAFWFRKAAENGSARAQNILGWMYLYGDCLEKDKTQAIYWYRNAANKGNISAQNQLIEMGLDWENF